MVGYLDIVGDFVEDPRRAAVHVRERKPWGLGLLGFAAGGLSLFLAQSLAGGSVAFAPGSIALILACLGRVVSGILFACVLHMVAEAAGADGSVGGLFVLLGLSDLVWTLALPIVLGLKLLSWNNGWTTFFLIISLGWASLRLKARSLRDNYGIGVGRSWFLLGVPYVAAVVLVLFLFFLAAVGMTLSLIRLFS